MRPSGPPSPGAGDRGAVTVEAAIALAALVVAVLVCLGALLAVSAQIRCVDAAREAARLAARGADTDAVPAAHRIAPPGARISVRTDGDRVVAVVSARAPALPMLMLRAEAVAAREPGEP
ncbi:TadE family type IV pilus minor pilin [Nocardia terpenica]|uniref:Pilus assembly protein TadE n=1 Tax=Nocardia terpenica TaxID=455432 RepID=A0A164HNN2_9NOCA|nr:TadE family type IV pilus minor pilin [Nocardia terpenica]KZM68666.1 pilus assembly protein TadE [Nocardia terpenica]NQE88341.1 pilus assembly protein TadE [Nocardia terpenica]